MSPYRSRLTLALLTASFLCPGVLQAQESAPRTLDPAGAPRLVERAENLIGTWDQRRDRDQNHAYRQLALAMADTLEAAGELVLATHLLEQAGILSYRFTEIDRALRTWERGLALARRSQDRTRIAALLNAKASGISAAGDDAAALDLQRELLTLRRELGDVRGEAVTWYNLAVSQIALFQYPEAITSLRNALRASLESGYDAGRAMGSNSLAQLLAKYGKIDEGLALADTAVTICERIDNPYFLGVALNTRATLLNELGRPRACLADLDRAAAEFEAAGFANAGDMIRVNRIDALVTLGHSQSAIADARALLENFHDKKPENELIARTVLGRALWHAGELDEALDVLSGTARSFRAMQDTLRGTVSASDAVRAVGVTTYLALLHGARAETREAWVVVEENLAHQLRQQLREDGIPVSLEEFQRALGERGAIALVYGVPMLEGCPAFLVTPSSIDYHEIDHVVALRRACAELGELLAGGSEGARFERLVAEVGTTLLGPFAEQLREKGQRVVIVPGGLSGLNFEVLSAHDGEALGEHVALSYAPSATAFVEFENRAVQNGGFVAFADAITDAEVTHGLWVERLRSVAGVPLPQARAEVRAIAPRRSETFVGAEATVAAFRQRAGGARVLHLATHALVDPGHPESSALVLAHPGQAGGVLLAAEISTLELAADLVCLSACGTAGGYRSPSEGVFGLTRAFLAAGARTVVSTWWEVEDTAARRFMELFYARLRDGYDRDEAARRARVAMHEEGYGSRDRAAFAVVGAVTGSLTDVLAAGPNPPARTWLLAGAGIALIAAALGARLRARSQRARVG